MNYDMKKRKIQVGETFKNKNGQECKVVSYEGWDKVLVEFNDSHKYRKTVRSNHLRNGTFKNPYAPTYADVGYIGVGTHKTGTKTHKIWSDMLNRCYSEKNMVKNRSYSDCVVCAAWCNFQNFAAWCESRKVKGVEMQIDKDIIKNGNKIYCPEYCSLVPADINALFIGSRSKNDLPLGVSIRKSNGKYKASICINGKSKALGEYDTPAEASLAYMKAKKEHIRSKAIEYRDVLEDRVFEALMNWGCE